MKRINTIKNIRKGLHLIDNKNRYWRVTSLYSEGSTLVAYCEREDRSGYLYDKFDYDSYRPLIGQPETFRSRAREDRNGKLYMGISSNG